MRLLRLFAAGIVLLCGSGISLVAAQPLTLTDSASLGDAFDEASGITHLGGSDWLMVSDGGNLLGELSANMDPSTGMFTAAPTLGSTYTLGGPGRDYEGLVYFDSTLLVSEETTPAVRKFSLPPTSTEAGGSPLPVTSPFNVPGNKRSNRGFEALTASPDGKTVWTTTEEALVSDGPVSTTSTGTIVRLLRYDLNTGTNLYEQTAQFAYQTDPIFRTQTGSSTPQSGVSDMALMPDGSLLILERSVTWDFFIFTDIPQFRNSIHRVYLPGATDVSGILALNGETFTPVGKQLLWEDASIGGNGTLSNMEGLTLGPATHTGISLLAVTDNQNQAPLTTELFAFNYISDIPEPGAMLIIGLAVLSVRRSVTRRRSG